MSRTPGPEGRSPFRAAPRTPGPLGVNDAASPYAPVWLRGDSPGPLGVNDHASPSTHGGHSLSRERAKPPAANEGSAWEKFLDSLCNWRMLSGPRIAWESLGHDRMTTAAVRAAPDQLAARDANPIWLPGDALPPRDLRRRLLLVLGTLPDSVVAADYTLEQFSDTTFGRKTKLSQWGQATHFMANKGQSQRTAYAAGVEKIFGPTETAVTRFKGMKKDSDIGQVSDALGDGIHALQDSFSPAHVQRTKVGNKLVIMRIKVWGEQDKKDHAAGDRSWEDASGSLTELGQACKEATIALLTYFIFSVINKDRDAERFRRLLMDTFLCPANSSISGW